MACDDMPCASGVLRGSGPLAACAQGTAVSRNTRDAAAINLHFMVVAPELESFTSS